MSAEDEVQQASEQFYAALNRTLDGDSSQMEQVWSHGSDVSAIHPFGGRMLGWEEVGARGAPRCGIVGGTGGLRAHTFSRRRA